MASQQMAIFRKVRKALLLSEDAALSLRIFTYPSLDESIAHSTNWRLLQPISKLPIEHHCQIVDNVTDQKPKSTFYGLTKVWAENCNRMGFRDASTFSAVRTIREHLLLHSGVRWISCSTMTSCPATATQRVPNNEEEQDEDKVLEQRKIEASPEECDQAVAGLSSVKANTKRVQAFLKKDESMVKRFWTALIGVGPALRAVASMSREDWARKLLQWKHDFFEALQHYWMGTKLLWVDVRISFRLLLKLASGKSLSRRERQQLTRTTADIFRLVPFAVFIIVPFMEFLLPVFLKVFPNMLPSTFQDKMREEVFLYHLTRIEIRAYFAQFFEREERLLMEQEFTIMQSMPSVSRGIRIMLALEDWGCALILIDQEDISSTKEDDEPSYFLNFFLFEWLFEEPKQN